MFCVDLKKKFLVLNCFILNILTIFYFAMTTNIVERKRDLISYLITNNLQSTQKQYFRAKYKLMDKRMKIK